MKRVKMKRTMSVPFIIAGITAIFLLLSGGIISSAIAATNPGDLGIDNQTLVSKKRLGRSAYQYTYTMDVINSSTANGYSGVSATVTSNSPNTMILDGEILFPDVAAGESETSITTFSFRQNRRVLFNPDDLVWTITGTAVPNDPDADGDTYPASLDCDDGNAAINPGAVEIILNGMDDDCNPATLDDPDADEDTYPASLDCNDNDAGINPGAVEIILNGVDDDCNPETLDDPDADEDTYPASTDCDDNDAGVNPGASEVTCDGIDNDCNPETLDAPDGNGCDTMFVPNPEDVAPPLDPTVSTHLYDATVFLYTGSNPIQTGVVPQTIDPERVAVIKGMIKDNANAPLGNVSVTILDHSEYGQTFTRADGEYDLAVNGGGIYTLHFYKPGYLPAQRKTEPEWQNYTLMEDVVLIPVTGPETPVSLGGSGIQVVRGNLETDGDGARQATLLIPPGTGASMQMPDGSQTSLSDITMSITEYTVGSNGPQAMPGELPASSAYTYAAEFQVKEAEAAGATAVIFDQPVYGYIEDFIGFPIGTRVPSGYYDRVKAAWIPSADGRVIEILSITNNAADIDADGDGGIDNGYFDIDTDGDGFVDTAIDLNISLAERQQLATLYSAGQTLWRVPMQHLSPFDWNHPPPITTKNGAVPPNNQPPSLGTTHNDNPSKADDYGILDIQNQAFIESVMVTGTPYSLNYSSARVPGNTSAWTITVPLTSDTLPLEVPANITAKATVAGKTYAYSMVDSLGSVNANASHTFVWDGKDGYGREVHGQVPVTISVRYLYNGYYSIPESFSPWYSFAQPGRPGMILIPTRDRYIGKRQVFNMMLDTAKLWYTKEQGLGGWTVSVHHAYDPQGRMVHLGDGTSQKGNDIFNVLTHLSGAPAPDGPSGDGGAAAIASLKDPRGVAVSPDGTIYFIDDHQIRMITTDGMIQTIAGDDESGYSGDDGPAIDAAFYNPQGLDIGPDGSLYIADTDNGVIRKITPDGNITTVAGHFNNDDDGYGFNTEPESRLNIVTMLTNPKKIFNLFFVKINSLFKTKEAVAAGAGSLIDNGDGGPAIDATLESPYDIAVDKDGSFYITEEGYGRIRKVDTNGIISTYAGGSDNPVYPDEWVAARDSSIFLPHGLDIGPDGSLYFAVSGYGNNRVRRIFPNGIVTTVAGTGEGGYSGDGGPAIDAKINDPNGIVVTDDGTLYFSEGPAQRIRKVDTKGIISTVVGTGHLTVKNADGAPGTAVTFDMIDEMNIALAPDGSLVFSVKEGRPNTDRFSSLFRLNQSALPKNSAVSTIIPNRQGSGVYVFDSQGRHLETRHALTGETTLSFEYDGNNRLASITDADGNVTAINRNESGEPFNIVAANGQSTEFTVDENGYLETITNPADSILAFDYNPGGLLNHMTRPNGNVYTFGYDSQGRLVQATKPDGTTKTLSRLNLNEMGQNGYEITLTNGLGNTQTFRMEQLPNNDVQHTIIHPDGLVSTRLVKSDGSVEYSTPDGMMTTVTTAPDPRFGMMVPVIQNLTSTTPGGIQTTIDSTRTITLADPADLTVVDSKVDTTTINGRTFTTSYNGLTRRTNRTTPTGRSSSMTIDTIGRIIASQVSNLAPVSYSYDTDGQLTQISQGARMARYEYDGLNNLTRMIDAIGNSADFTHTPEGKINQKTNALGNTIDFNYTPNGRMTVLTTPNGNGHQYIYNAVDMPAGYIDPVGNPVVYGYDADQNMTWITQPDTSIIGFNYDAASRTTRIATSDGIAVQQTYDSSGRLDNVQTGTDLVNYSYDGIFPTQIDLTGTFNGNIQMVYDNNLWFASLNILGQSIGFGYDDDGKMTSAGDLTIVRDPVNALITHTSLDIVTDATTYNSFGEPLSYQAVTDTTLYAANYTWNDLGFLTGKIETINGSTTVYNYQYDAIGQLIQVDNNTSTELYIYDANHNRVALLTNTGDFESGTYDSQDRLVTYNDISFTYDLNGMLESKSDGTVYTHTSTGLLTSALLPDGTRVTYRYDGLERRIERQVENGSIKRFVYLNNLNPVAELDASNAVVSRFVYASRTNVPDYMIKNGINYRFIKDHIGSVRLIVNTSSGAIAQQLDYDPFGRVINDTNPGFQPFGFAGGLYDPDTGLVHFDRRDYDSSTGRWTTKDPIRFAGSSTNLYAYVNNNPINRIDPTGLKDITASQVIDAADQAVTYEGLGYEAAENIAKYGLKNPGLAKDFAKAGDTLSYIGTGTSFLKYVDTANAYYYDGKGSLGDVAHDLGNFANSILGLFPPYKPISTAISIADTASTPILTSLFTQHYINKSSGVNNHTSATSGTVTPTFVK